MKANAVAKRPKPPLSKRLKRDWHKNKWKYIMLLPVLIYLLLFCYKPMYGLVIAFKDYKITRGIEGSIFCCLGQSSQPYQPHLHNKQLVRLAKSSA